MSPLSIALQFGTSTKLAPVAPAGLPLQGGLMSLVPMPWRTGASRDEFHAALPPSVLLIGQEVQ